MLLASLAVDNSLLILSDTHLSRGYGKRCGQELATLLRAHADCELVFAGDIFDLSLDAPTVPLRESLGRALAPHGELLDALKQHTQRGGRLTIVPGNHDGPLFEPDLSEELRRHIQPQRAENVQVCPWFLRRGDLHIEHGHLYDPDCAPNHPLADSNRESEGLGTALMRRFVAPNDALIFAHAHETTPLSGLRTAIQKWKIRSPLLIANYFRTAGGLMAEARATDVVERDRAQGTALVAQHARGQGLKSDALEQLLYAAPVPTHHSVELMFRRLYFDRILSGVCLSVGLGLLAARGLGTEQVASTLFEPSGMLSFGGLLLLAFGAGSLAGSLRRDHQAGEASVVERLEQGARAIRETTGAPWVILGHSHVEADEPGYLNLGSFGFPRGLGRPYLLASASGRPQKYFFRV